MIKEENFGYRDKRGHFVPKEAADKNPIWILPFNLKPTPFEYQAISFIIFVFSFTSKFTNLLLLFLKFFLLSK